MVFFIDYCSFGWELCLWKVDDGYIIWKNVSCEEIVNWNKKVKLVLNVDYKVFEGMIMKMCKGYLIFYFLLCLVC